MKFSLSDHILKLYQYHSWSNLKLLDHLEQLPDHLFLAPVESVFPSISHTFTHIYWADTLWFSRIQGGNPTQITQNRFENIAEAKHQFHQMEKEVYAFIQQEYNLQKTIHYQNTKGMKFENAVYEIFQHLVNHGTYHRGNISAMIRQQGHGSVSSDYIFYLREDLI